MEGRVIAVNAAFSEFPLDLQQLMKSSGVLVVTASQISSDSRVLVGSAAVVYTKKGLGRSKAEELDEMLGYANGVYKKEVFNTQVFVQELSAVLRVTVRYLVGFNRFFEKI